MKWFRRLFRKSIPKAERVVSDDCVKLIQHFEGCKRKQGDRIYAYRDPVGIPTIGWGTIQYESGERVKMGAWITQERADNLFEWEIKQKADGVTKLVRVPLEQYQFDALVSFAYNLGLGALKSSTLLRKLNKRDYQGASMEFQKWVYAEGEILSGLVRRRESESRLFRGFGTFIVPG